MEANASRYHGKAPDEIAWAEPERQTRAVKEYLDSLEAENEANPNRKAPKVISPSDPCSAWTAKANKRVQFGYRQNGFEMPELAPRSDSNIVSVRRTLGPSVNVCAGPARRVGRR